MSSQIVLFANASFVSAFIRQTEELVLAVEAGNEEAFDTLLRRAEQAQQELGAEFVEENIKELLNRASVADQRNRAEKAANVAEVKKQASEAPKVRKGKSKRQYAYTYTAEETRQNAADVIARYSGFENAAEALGTDLCEVDGRTASQIGRVLAEAMKATRPEDGKWVFHGWVRDAMRLHRDNAQKLGSESLVMVFLANLLNALTTLGADKVSNDMLIGAQRTLENAKPVEEWAPWALDAVDRLICKGELHPWDGCSRAENFLARLHQEVNKGIQRHREANAERKRAKDASNAATKAVRAADCQARKGK